MFPVPRLENESGTPRICWPSEIAVIAAASRELTPSVAMNESMRTRTMRNPPNNPMRTPLTPARIMETGPEKPMVTRSHAVKTDPAPT
jgi:hypothetical protein